MPVLIPCLISSYIRSCVGGIRLKDSGERVLTLDIYDFESQICILGRSIMQLHSQFFENGMVCEGNRAFYFEFPRCYKFCLSIDYRPLVYSDVNF